MSCCRKYAIALATPPAVRPSGRPSYAAGGHTASWRQRLFRLEGELPMLAHEIVTEASMRLLADEVEASALIDPTCGNENALCPERDLAITRPTREADAFRDQAPADVASARLGLDQKQPELCRLFRLFDEKDRADIDPVALGDPA